MNNEDNYKIESADVKNEDGSEFFGDPSERFENKIFGNKRFALITDSMDDKSYRYINGTVVYLYGGDLKLINASEIKRNECKAELENILEPYLVLNPMEKKE
jgi:uncharacterized protein (UPF0297 family)